MGNAYPCLNLGNPIEVIEEFAARPAGATESLDWYRSGLPHVTAREPRPTIVSEFYTLLVLACAFPSLPLYPSVVLGITTNDALSIRIRKKGNNCFDPFFDLFVRKGGKKRKARTSRSYVVTLEMLTSKDSNKVQKIVVALLPDARSESISYQRVRDFETSTSDFDFEFNQRDVVYKSRNNH